MKRQRKTYEGSQFTDALHHAPQNRTDDDIGAEKGAERSEKRKATR